jgi:hypothetical protein
MVAVEVRAQSGHHRRGWRGDRGGPIGHGGGGGAVVLDLAEKEAKQNWQRRRMVLGRERWQRRMVLGGGTANVVRMAWGQWCGKRGEYQ